MDYPEFPPAFHITGFEGQLELGMVLGWRPQRLRQRYLDEFDYVPFLDGTVETTGLGGRKTDESEGDSLP